MKEYFIRALKDGEIVKTAIKGSVFDIVIETPKGDISIDLNEGMVRIHTPKGLIVHPNAGNSISIESGSE